MNTFVKLRVVVRVSVLYTLVAFGNTCGPSEYKSSEGECCPMCNIGNHVYWHCTEDTSTTCVPCLESTYTDEPNHLLKCLPCSVCDAAKGIRVRKACTRTADVICEPQEGFYCISQNKPNCALAVKHTECSPGQYIKQKGTTASDAVCVDCPSGFYSPTGVNCTRWTDCAAKNEIETEAGSSIKDVTCAQQKRGRYGLVVLVPAGVIAIIAIIYCLRSQKGSELKVSPLCCIFYKKQTKTQSNTTDAR